MAQKASGKGFENESNYQNMKSFFFAIENIHVMRNSLQKLVEGDWVVWNSVGNYDNCWASLFLTSVSSRKTTVTQFLSGLESSGWLKHVRTVMETGVFIAEVQYDDCGVNIPMCLDWNVVDLESGQGSVVRCALLRRVGSNLSNDQSGVSPVGSILSHH